jgi:hypothetical protein
VTQSPTTGRALEGTRRRRQRAPGGVDGVSQRLCGKERRVAATRRWTMRHVRELHMRSVRRTCDWCSDRLPVSVGNVASKAGSCRHVVQSLSATSLGFVAAVGGVVVTAEVVMTAPGGGDGNGTGDRVRQGRRGARRRVAQDGCRSPASRRKIDAMTHVRLVGKPAKRCAASRRAGHGERPPRDGRHLGDKRRRRHVDTRRLGAGCAIRITTADVLAWPAGAPRRPRSVKRGWDAVLARHVERRRVERGVAVTAWRRQQAVRSPAAAPGNSSLPDGGGGRDRLDEDAQTRGRVLPEEISMSSRPSSPWLVARLDGGPSAQPVDLQPRELRSWSFEIP